MNSPIQRAGEYELKGDYHKNIDKNWRYYPVYHYKMKYIDSFLSGIPKTAKILDMGCGEGHLVDKNVNPGMILLVLTRIIHLTLSRKEISGILLLKPMNLMLFYVWMFLNT